MTHLVPCAKAAAIVLLLSLAAAAQNPNILTNGDFSKGFACYTMWGWSNPNVDTNWMFYLSNDAPLGTPYSGEAHCHVGSSCTQQVGISTDPIPIDSGKTYKFTGSYKCSKDSGSASFQITTTANDIRSVTYLQDNPLTCNNAWTQVTYDNISPVQSQTMMQISFYFTPLEAGGLQVGNFTLTYHDGTVPQQTVYDSGDRNVAFGPGSNYISVDKAPYFALGFYNVPPADFPTLKASVPDANTVLSTESVTPAYKCFNTAQIPGLNLQDYRDWAYVNGLNLIPDSMFAARTGTDDSGSYGVNGTGGEATLPTITNTYAHHLANIGWSLADEPDLGGIPWFYLGGGELGQGGELKNLAQSARQNMDLPLFAILFCPTHPNDGQDCSNFNIADYNGATDIWGAEPYGDDWDKVNGTFTNLRNALNTFASVQPIRPMWFALDGNTGWPDSYQDVMISKAYYSVINGVTGILYFDWNTFNYAQPSLLGVAEQVFRELNQLAAPILSGNPVVVSSSQGLPVMGRSKGPTYVIVVNPTNSNYPTVQFSLPGLTAGKQINVLFENRNITSSNGGFTDLQGLFKLKRHVYQIEQ